MASIPWRDYEELVKFVMQRLSIDAPVETVSIERSVTLQGRATDWKIDVVWEYIDEDGRACRVLIEARSYKDKLKQSAVGAFRHVVDDLSDGPHETFGMMVTTAGFQEGGERVAETYGIIILELREPTEADTAGRAVTIDLRIDGRVPFVREVELEAVEEFEQPGPVLSTELFVQWPDGRTTGLVPLMLDGELSTIYEPPTQPHRVRRSFEEPVVVVWRDRPIAAVTALSALVGEAELPTVEVPVSRRSRVAYLLKNALNGTCAWFSADGEFFITD